MVRWLYGYIFFTDEILTKRSKIVTVYGVNMIFLPPHRQKGDWRSMIRTTSTSRNQPGLQEAEEGQQQPMGQG